MFVIVVFILLLIFFNYCTSTYGYWKRRGVIYPTPIPLFGNYYKAAILKEHRSKFSSRIYNQFPNEKVVGIYRYRTPMLFIRDLEIMKNIFIKDFECFQDRGLEFSEKNLGANLFHADKDTWPILRRRMSPIFTTFKLKSMFHCIRENSNTLVEYLDALLETNCMQEVTHLMGKYTAEATASCSFGISIDAFKETDNKFITLTNKHLMGKIPKTLEFMFPGFLKALNMSFFPRDVVTFFTDISNRIVRDRENKPKLRHDLMDLMVSMKEEGLLTGKRIGDDTVVGINVTDGVIASQFFTFFLAGYETSSSTLAFLLRELALNQDIQDKVIEEIDNTMLKNNGITYDSLKEMIYCNMALSETMRMYPVVDPLIRNTGYNYKIPGTEVILEKDTLIMLPVTAIHTDPQYYPQPEKFDPERFSADNVKKRHPCAWLPFGSGPRHCIGLRFARTQMMVVLATLLSKFRVEPSERTAQNISTVPERLTLRAKGGIWLNFKKRNIT